MREEIAKRFLEFAAEIVTLGKQLKKTFEGQHTYQQLFRSATSAGANYEESHSAESTKDFIHKRQISLKELRESLYWLKLIEHAALLNKSDKVLNSLLQENEELIKILAKSVATTKKNI